MEHSWPTARNPDEWWWVFDPRQSLRARAMLVFGGAALAFALLVGWTAATLFRRNLTRQLGTNFETLAFQVGDKLDRSLEQQLRALELAGGLPALKDSATPIAVRRALLDTLLDAAPDCAWIGLADRDGRVTIATQQRFEKTNVASTAWFRNGQRGPFAGNLHEFVELARELPNLVEEHPLFLDLAVPVNDADGALIGVLGAHLRWSWARDTQLSVVPEGARRDHLGVTIYAATGDVLLDSGATGWTHPPEAPAVGERIGARGNLIETVPGDADYLTGFARTKGFREFRGANWLVVVRQPLADATAPVGELHAWIVRFGFVFVLLVAVAGWVAAGRISRRMAAVATAAGRIRRGDVLTLMPHPPGRGELQDMCGALDQMVADFRAKQEKSEPAEKR